MINNGNNLGFGIPLYFSIRGVEQDTAKLSEDRYEVFVEEDYIGDKSMYAQNEDFHAICDFLEKQGFSNVEVELDGDHIVVHTDSHSQANEMRKALEVYLNNR